MSANSSVTEWPRPTLLAAPWALACCAGITIFAPGRASAAEGTELASAMDEDDPFDLFVGLDYEFTSKEAAIKREFAGPEDGVADGPVPVVKDLVFHETRHVITPHLQVGVFHDLELSVALPIVVSDSRRYDLDQRLGDGCVFTGADANCVDRQNSSTFRDRILPDSGASFGYDALEPAAGFSSGSTVFRGIDRAGLDQIHLGVSWAPMNQARDDTKPTWALGAEFRLAIGKRMAFDRNNPGGEDSVGRGVNEVKLWTSLSKRLTWAEPFVTLWYLGPLGSGAGDPTDASGTKFWDVGFGQDSTTSQQSAGTSFGFNGITWQNRRQQQYLAIEVRARVDAHFQGRGYGEAWELFALGGDVTTNTDAPLRIDLDPTTTTDSAVAHPGVTTIENYMTFGGRLGLRGQLGENAKFSASFELAYDQQHRISWTDAGKESDDPDKVVTPGTAEVNPLFTRAIDIPGRRYLVDESLSTVFLLSGTLMF